MRARLALALLAVCSGWSTPGWAHSPVPGIEGFYVGMWHPMTVPGQILLLAVVGLLLGFRGVKAARPSFIAFIVTLVLGATFGRSVPAEAIVGWIPLAAVLLTAPALLFRSGEAVAIAVATLGGLVVGLGSLPEPGPIGAVAITLAGSLAGIPFMMLCMTAAAEAVRTRLPPVWTGTVAGVTGAWVMAIAMLLMALEIRL